MVIGVSNPHVVLIFLDNFVCILDTIWDDDDALKRFILTMTRFFLYERQL
jgi:hypothetical protein